MSPSWTLGDDIYFTQTYPSASDIRPPFLRNMSTQASITPDLLAHYRDGIIVI